MGSYRREYEEYYRDLKNGFKGRNYYVDNEIQKYREESDLYIRSRGIYRNDVSGDGGFRGGYYCRRKNEKTIGEFIFTEIIATMLVFLILSSFSLLNGFGKTGIYNTTKSLIEKNYTVEEVKDLFGIINFIKDLKLDVK